MIPIGAARAGVVSGGGAIPDSVTHRYQFNEGSGSTAIDSVGNSDATITGATYTTDSREGSHALSFDGDDYVNSNHVPITDLSFSWMAWVKTGTLASTEYLLSSAGTSGDNTEGVNILLNTDGTVTVNSGGGVDDRPLGTTSAAVDNNSYHLISLTYDGTIGKVFIDDSEDISSSWDPYESVENLYFGRRGIRNESHYNGVLDDVLEADDAVTGSEITNYINSVS